MSQILNGRYTIIEPISRGGIGVIYRAIDEQTGQTIAIKQLKDELSANPSFVAQFEREKQALQQINHPNIVKLLDSIVTADGDYYLVMEYVPGMSLAERLESGPLPIDQALTIALDVAYALQDVHQLGIIHADIKPGNILLDETGSPRLMDFGAAYVPQSTWLAQTATTLGTFAYMSPEVCQDEALDTRTDIWSFGVMLYEMLSGKRPFDHPNLSHLTLAIMTEPPPDLQEHRPEISDRLADLIYRMLTKDRNWRIPKMSYIIIELDAILYGSSTIDTGFLARVVALADEGTDNLPLLTNTLIGRETELTELKRLLVDSAFRLITLHGPGGIGKTSLALAAAHHYHQQTQASTYFIDLSSLDQANQIVTAIADAIHLNFFGSADPRTELINYLQQKEMLLVLDNFEQVTQASSLLTDILFQSFGVQLLVTSQDRLNLIEELRIPVRGLPVPEEATYDGLLNAPAVQLFLQSVRHVQPNFAPTADDMRAIHEICRLVDGLPLGIKLAATSMNVMTPAEIARQIRVGADVLSVGLPDLPARHRSLRSVFEYSWILLNEEEKRDLRYLSVFRGGFERDAARQYGISLQTLNAFTDKSLLRRSPETGRYDLPVMFRRFAMDKLGERPSEQSTAHQSHANYYLRFLQSREPHLSSEQQLIALHEIDMEMGNIQAAWQWATHNGDRKGIGLGIEALYTFYQVRGRQQECAKLFQATVAVLEPQPDIVFAKLLARLGACNRLLGQPEQARPQLEQSLQLARRLQDDRHIVFALCHLGIALGNDPAARVYLEESCSLAEAIGDRPLLAESLNWLAFAHYQEGDLQTAVQLLEKSLAISRELRATHGLAVSLTNLGIIYGHRSQTEEALQMLKEALQHYKQLNDLHGMAAACNNLCYIALNNQNYRAARIWAEQALAYQREVGSKQGISQALAYLSEIAFYQSDFEQARLLCQEGLALYRDNKANAAPFLNTLGRIALAEANYQLARKTFQLALSYTPSAALTLNILTGFAVVMIEGELLPAATALLLFIEQHPASEPLIKERATAQLTAVKPSLKPSQYEAARSRSDNYSLADWSKIAQSLTISAEDE